MLNLGWAAILIGLSGCLGSVIDAMIVGNLINEDSVSAINLSRPLLQLMYTVNLLLTTGAGMLVGMELGKQDTRRASYIFIISMLACLLTSLVFMAYGLVAPDVVTRLLCDHDQLYRPTYAYLRVMLIRAPAAVVGHVVGIAMMGFHFFSKENHLRLACGRQKPVFGAIISQGAPLAIASTCLTVLMFSSNKIILSSLGRTGIYAFALCMNLLLIYNLFLGGVLRTIQSLGSIQVGKGDNEAFTLVLRKSFNFITGAMVITCVYVWIWPESIVMLFGANEAGMIAEGCHALRIYALSPIFFCYIHTIMIVYKLYNYHHMALFISFALSLTVIPVLWLFSIYAKEWIWYGFLVAYIIEAIAIFVLHKMTHVKFELKINNNTNEEIRAIN